MRDCANEATYYNKRLVELWQEHAEAKGMGHLEAVNYAMVRERIIVKTHLALSEILSGDHKNKKECPLLKDE